MPLLKQVPLPQNKILVILHQEMSTPGRIGRLLQELGYTLDIRRPRFGDPLPETMADHAAAVIFGGPMSANDEDAFICQEIDWIGVPLREGKPFLGVCLGGQMLARHLGHRVAPHAEGRVESGYYPILPTSEGRTCGGGHFPDYVFQAHREGFDLPNGATLLAESAGDFATQAFRYGPSAFALQFHPEVTYAMICRWSTRGLLSGRLERPGARPQHEQLRGWFLHDPDVARWLHAFLPIWLASGGTPMLRETPAKRPAFEAPVSVPEAPAELAVSEA